MDRQEAEATQVGHAMNMVAELPRLTDDRSLPVAARVACLESYFMNLRVLVDFYARRRDDRDIHRHDFLPAWDPAASSTVERLKREWDFASKQVAHLSKSRIVEDGDLVVNLAPQRLELMTALLFDIAEEFCSALEEDGHPLAKTFQSFLMEARSRLSPG